MVAAEQRHQPFKFFSGNSARSKVGVGLHEPAAYQGKHLVIQWSHLLALLSGNFLLDAAQNNKVTQKSR